MHKHLALLLASALFFQCAFPVTYAFLHLFQGEQENNGLLQLLAAGLIAKFLSQHHHEEEHHTHYVPIPMYIGHHYKKK